MRDRVDVFNSQRSRHGPAAALVLLLLVPALAGAADWQPEKTWVFAVGCMEWKHDRELNMPKKGRQDQVLIDTLKARGVPQDQIVFLKDKQGTMAHIRSSFRNLLEKTRKDDFLIFYFQGHGSRDIAKNKSTYYFINYDADDRRDESYFYMRIVLDLIDEHFKGSQALLLADCCCSGGLILEANSPKRKKPTPIACLTSVFAHNGSTGNWTFTEALIKGLKGNPVVDLDADGQVTLEELSRYIDSEMAFVEQQKSAFAAVHGFEGNLKLSTAGKKSHPDVGKYVEARQEKEWYRAKIEAVKGGRCRVSYTDYDEKEWVPRDRIRDFKPNHWEAGKKVRAKSEEDDEWRAATVVKAFQGLHLVHFDRKTAVHDEWLAPDRIKPKP